MSFPGYAIQVENVSKTFAHRQGGDDLSFDLAHARYSACSAITRRKTTTIP
jgi:hypothetical protein